CQLAMMPKDIVLNLLGVGHIETAGAPLQLARIARLTARFGVKRCGIKHHNSLSACFNAFDRCAVDIQRSDSALPLQMLISVETCFCAAIAKAINRLEFAGGSSLVALAC